jgi:hypothetical protein
MFQFVLGQKPSIPASWLRHCVESFLPNGCLPPLNLRTCANCGFGRFFERGGPTALMEKWFSRPSFTAARLPIWPVSDLGLTENVPVHVADRDILPSSERRLRWTIPTGSFCRSNRSKLTFVHSSATANPGPFAALACVVRMLQRRH